MYLVSKIIFFLTLCERLISVRCVGLTLTRPDAKMLVSCEKFKLYQKTVKNGHLVKNPSELAEELRQ